MKEDLLGVSPFVPSLSIPQPLSAHWESETHFRMYCSSKNRLQMAKLSFRGLQLWIWMMYEIGYENDFVRINVERMMQECKIKTRKTYKAAVDELRKVGWITPCVGHKNVYWINPAIAFKGSRGRAFPENTVKKQTTE